MVCWCYIPAAATRVVSLAPSCEDHSAALGSGTLVSQFSADSELQQTTSVTLYVASLDAVQQPTREQWILETTRCLLQYLPPLEVLQAPLSLSCLG